ncbi:MAG: hypothetical protein ACRDL5_12780 [Solirubrobacteraceae bacterium]
MVWLTSAGVESAGLGGVRAVKSPPSPTTIAHAVLVGWSAARAEHRGRTWKSARELALERERWAVRARCERGYTEQLPDLAVWLDASKPPGAVIAESGGRREDRQRWILEGWRDAIWSGRYIVVRYDCASPSVAHWIARLAKKVGLTGSDFMAAVQTTAEQIAALSPAAATDVPAVDDPQRSSETVRTDHQPNHSVPIYAPSPAAPTQPSMPAPAQSPLPETAEAAAGRERRYREIFGIDDQKPQRPWRRRR